MSFDKAIKHRKERRKPYYGNKSIDPHCRNHGCCSWCEENRKYQSIKQEERIKDMEKEYDNGRNKGMWVHKGYYEVL